jgi:hypothetical protein
VNDPGDCNRDLRRELQMTKNLSLPPVRVLDFCEYLDCALNGREQGLHLMLLGFLTSANKDQEVAKFIVLLGYQGCL